MRSPKILTASLAALALAACGGNGGEVPKGEPIAKVAAPAGKQWSDVVAKTDKGFVMGNPNAKLELVEYGAITCPGCAQFSDQSHSELTEMVNTGRVKFEFRPFLVHGIQDMPGFLLTQCNGPEAYFALTEQLYAQQATWLGRLQTLTEAEQQQVPTMKPEQAVQFLADKFGLIDIVKQLGVSEDAARACLADKAAFDKLAKNTETTMAEGKVTGTPTFFLNGVRLDVGAWPQVKGKLMEAGAR
ncbi:MAG: DsbA family protein [Sphingorhabdus sp.]